MSPQMSKTGHTAVNPEAEQGPAIEVAVRLPSDLSQSRPALELLGATPGQFDMPLSGGQACWWRLRQGDPRPNALIVYTRNGVERAAYPGDWVRRDADGFLDVWTTEPTPGMNP